MTSQITEDTQTSAAPRNRDVRGNSIRFYSDSMLRFLVSFVSSSLKSNFFFYYYVPFTYDRMHWANNKKLSPNSEGSFESASEK